MTIPFWPSAFAAFALLSLATANPAPLAILLVAWLISWPLERSWGVGVELAGREVDAVPNPTRDGYSCLSCLAWLVVFGGLGLLAVASVVGVFGKL